MNQTNSVNTFVHDHQYLWYECWNTVKIEWWFKEIPNEHGEVIWSAVLYK